VLGEANLDSSDVEFCMEKLESKFEGMDQDEMLRCASLLEETAASEEAARTSNASEDDDVDSSSNNNGRLVVVDPETGSVIFVDVSAPSCPRCDHCAHCASFSVGFVWCVEQELQSKLSDCQEHLSALGGTCLNDKIDPSLAPLFHSATLEVPLSPLPPPACRGLAEASFLS
jgi:hypothetical protein